MTAREVPADRPAVSPYLVVADPPALIGFLREVFGAEELLRVHRPDGTVMHAEARIRDSVVMLGGSTGEYPATLGMLHVYVADADNVFEKALAAGATPIMPPAEKGDGDRRGGFVDPAGNQWWVAARIRALSADEIERGHQAA